MRYRWSGKDRSWRKRRIRGAARKHESFGRNNMLRVLLFAGLAVEILVGSRQHFDQQGIRFELLRKEEVCQAEWIVQKNECEGTNPALEVTENRYGIRFHPETMELQFYHAEQELVPKTLIDDH